MIYLCIMKLSYIEEYTNLTNRETKNKSAVYIILNKINKKYYIGGTINLYDRLKAHIRDLINNKHNNTYLQNSFNKYGIENFEFDILEEYPPNLVFYMEDYWTNILNARDRKYGFNNRAMRDGRSGKHSLESIEKMKKNKTYTTHSEETREKIRKAITGRKLSEEHKKNISKSNIGKTVTKEGLKKLSINNRITYGRKIVILNKKGIFVDNANSLAEASEKTEASVSGVFKVAQGKGYSSNGYIFIYKEKYDENLDYDYNRNKKNRSTIQKN